MVIERAPIIVRARRILELTLWAQANNINDEDLIVLEAQNRYGVLEGTARSYAKVVIYRLRDRPLIMAPTT
ncbi:MAG: hypothetical protein ACPLY9_02080 [Nitrososphaerales archaeon]